MQIPGKRALPLATVASIAACAIGLAPPAQSQPANVVTAIKAQNKVIEQTPGWKDLQRKINLRNTAKAKMFIVDLGKLETTAQRAVRVVARSSTTDAKQRQGKADWVKGSRLQNRGIRQLQRAIRAFVNGHKTMAKKEVVSALGTLIAGTREGVKGDKLLGLPVTD